MWVKYAENFTLADPIGLCQAEFPTTTWHLFLPKWLTSRYKCGYNPKADHYKQQKQSALSFLHLGISNRQTSDS